MNLDSLSEEKAKAVYEFIRSYTEENDFPPSIREICNACSIKSTATTYMYIERLVRDGLLYKQNTKKRAIRLAKPKCRFVSAPILGQITAGAPILAVENFDGYFPLPAEFGQDVFMLTVQGTSMINAGIHDGDKIVVRAQDTAENGDIVAALDEDKATVKRFYKRDGHFVLHPENPEYEDIILDNVEILGKVIGLVRHFK